MKQAICSFIYHKILGWKAEVSVPDFDKCIICAAPHTTNWDLFIGKLFISAIGRESGFMMKKEWFFFPLGLIFKAVGGIPVDRGRKTSLVDQMAARFARSKKFQLAITPEGTRKANPNWKKGFYYIAKGAGVPIQLAYLDFGKREMGITEVFYPTDDEEADFKHIFNYYKGVEAKKPENFLIPE